MKALIFCGGFGTRIKNFRKNTPKPLIKIKNKEILLRILEIYKKNNVKEFYLLCGNNIKKFKKFKDKYTNFNINIMNTGYYSLTQKRLFFAKKILLNENYFCLTYGDSLAHFNLKQSIKNIKKNKSLLNLLVFRNKDKYGSVSIKNNKIINFHEKKINYINAGFYLCSTKILRIINKNNLSFEKDCLIKLSKIRKISFSNTKFWMPMDDKNDYLNLKEYLL